VRGTPLMFICALFALALIAAPTAMAADGPGGVAYDEPPAAPPATPGATGATDLQPTVPGVEAKIVNGLAAAPAAAPDAVKQAIWAANGIIGRPYRYGGGHARGFTDRGYDCSGTVSFALHGGNLLETTNLMLLQSDPCRSGSVSPSSAMCTPPHSMPGVGTPTVTGFDTDTPDRAMLP